MTTRFVALKNTRDFARGFWGLLAGFMVLAAPTGEGQDRRGREPELDRSRFRNGSATLGAFLPAMADARQSVVKLDVDGATVALGAVVEASGWVLTKASELRPGKLTAWIAGGREVEARAWAVDEENDLALVRIRASGLRPVRWARGEVDVGQWTVTPGIEQEPQAVGIVSSPPRKIRRARALIGVQLDRSPSGGARIEEVMPGMGAAEAGMRAGDVIVAVNATPIPSREALIEALRDYHDGQSVRVRVKRSSDEFEVDVPLRETARSGGDRSPDRQERMNRMGSELSRRSAGFSLIIQHDTVLQAWQCGGPLLDLDGQALGLNIARAGRVATYALPAEIVRRAGQALLRKAKASGAPVAVP